MERKSELRRHLAENLFLLLWAGACLGLVAVSAWIFLKETRRGSELRALEDYLQSDDNFAIPNDLPRLLDEFAGLQKRAALPLAVDAPKAGKELTRRLNVLAVRLGENAEMLAHEFAAKPNQEVPEPPTVCFTHFSDYQHVLRFTRARSFQREPRYSFRLEFRQGPFAPENFQDLRRGDVVSGWKVEGAISRKVQGIFVERQDTDRRGRVFRRREKMPDFEIYRLSLSGKGKVAAMLTLPKSELDAQRARLSNHKFIDTLPGETSVAHLSIVGLGERPEEFEVKVGCEFVALGKTYRVRSVRPSALRLEDLSSGREVVWERGRRYD
jgi:hypothetical protein